MCWENYGEFKEKQYDAVFHAFLINLLITNDFMLKKCIYRYHIKKESIMDPLSKLLTTEQRRIYRKKYAEAKAYFNLQPGWVLHHKDETLRYSDIDRYVQWLPEDLIPLTRKQHSTLHGRKPHTEATKKKISESCMGRPSPVKGTHYTKRKDMKKVRCIETGVIYDSLNLASADTGDKVQYIYSWCKKGKGPGTCEFHWEYVK